jgi:hypothetical protein
VKIQKFQRSHSLSSTFFLVAIMLTFQQVIVLTGFAHLLQVQARVSGISEAVGDGAASHRAPYELLK